MSAGADWWERTTKYEADSHVQAQVDRIIEPYRLIHGTKDALTPPELLTLVARLMAVLDVNPDVERTANDSGIVVVRSPVDGNYDILLWACTAYGIQLGRRAH